MRMVLIRESCTLVNDRIGAFAQDNTGHYLMLLVEVLKVMRSRAADNAISVLPCIAVVPPGCA